MGLKENILITGIAGFIGSNVAKRFIAEGLNVIGVDDLSSGIYENIPKDSEFIEIDLSNKNSIKKIPKNCKYILHLAGQSSGEVSFDDPIEDLKKNTVSTLNLINYGIKNRVEKFVYASSMSVYGNTKNPHLKESVKCNPVSCYGAGKLASENYLKIYSNLLPFVSLRMFNVYGFGQDLNNLRQGMISIYLAQALKNNHILIKGGLNRFRDFININDVTEIWFQSIINSSIINEIVNVGTGKPTTVREVIEFICKSIDNCTFEVIEGTLGDQFGIYADTSKLRSIYGKKSFITIDDGLKSFIESTNNH